MTENPYKFAHLSRQPVIPIAHSFNQDFVRCLIDGKKALNLTAHLREEYGMTPEEYRAHFDLPVDHPVVCGRYHISRHVEQPYYPPVVVRVGPRKRATMKAASLAVVKKAD